MNEDVKAHVEALLFKKYVGALTDSEQEQLQSLLQEYPELLEIEREIATSVSKGILPSSPTTIITEQDTRLFTNRLAEVRKKRKLRPLKWLAAAAGVLAILAVGGNLFLKNDSDPESHHIVQNSSSIQLHLADGEIIEVDTERPPQTVQTKTASVILNRQKMNFTATDSSAYQLNELRVPPKLDYMITLSDGTTVRLNSGTALKFPFVFGAMRREVYIEGEAYFSVAKNAEKPFIVSTPSGRIEVLGTEFNINTYRKEYEKLSLVKGAVSVSNGKSTTILKPGEQAILNKEKISEQEFETSTTLSWLSGEFIFEATPLSEIADMIERWYDIPVIIDSPKLKDEIFTASLSKGKPLSQFLTMLENTTLVKHYYRGKELHLH